MKKSDIITGILAQNANTKSVEELEALTKQELEALIEGKEVTAPVKDDREKTIDVKVGGKYRKANLYQGKYYIKVRKRRFEVSEAGDLIADFEGKPVTLEELFPVKEVEAKVIDVTVLGLDRKAKRNKGKYWVRINGAKYAVTPEGEVYEDEDGKAIKAEDIEVQAPSAGAEVIDVIIQGKSRRAKLVNGIVWIKVRKKRYQVKDGEIVADADGKPVKTDDILTESAGSSKTITVLIDGVEHSARKSKKGHYTVTIRHFFNEAGEAIELAEAETEEAAEEAAEVEA